MCEIQRVGFVGIQLDNNEAYIKHLIGVVDSVDELSSMKITKTPHSYHFRIAPSVPMYTQSLLKELLKLHNVYGIHLDLSKSMRVTSTIDFQITLSE